MEWLNYHHLLYFWLVVREGGLARAAARLRLSHPTVRGQVRALEEALGEKLLVRQGRKLVLTEMGKLVHGYAEEIFTLGREMLDTVRGRPTGRPLRVVVGIAEVVPKLVAKRLLDPARSLSEEVELVCREDKTERLFGELALHELDVVLSDSPLPPGSGVRAFNHLLGDCGVTLFAHRELAARYRRGFPACLEGAPLLLPTGATSLRRVLEQWFDDHGVRPRRVAEFDDSALMKVFGQDGMGLFPSPSAIERAVCRQYGVVPVGRLEGARERFYAITVERRIRHPAVQAICDAARGELFGHAVAGRERRRDAKA